MKKNLSLMALTLLLSTFILQSATVCAQETMVDASVDAGEDAGDGGDVDTDTETDTETDTDTDTDTDTEDLEPEPDDGEDCSCSAVGRTHGANDLNLLNLVFSLLK